MTTLDTVLTQLDAIAIDAANAQEAVTMDATPTVEPTVDAPAMDTEAAKADPKFAHVPLTPELLTALRTAAGDKPLGPFVAAMLAKQYGVTLPETDGRKRYTTEEAREAAKLASRDKAANLRKALLAAHRARMAKDEVKLAAAELDIIKYS